MNRFYWTKTKRLYLLKRKDCSSRIIVYISLHFHRIGYFGLCVVFRLLVLFSNWHLRCHWYFSHLFFLELWHTLSEKEYTIWIIFQYTPVGHWLFFQPFFLRMFAGMRVPIFSFALFFRRMVMVWTGSRCGFCLLVVLIELFVGWWLIWDVDELHTYREREHTYFRFWWIWCCVYIACFNLCIGSLVLVEFVYMGLANDWTLIGLCPRTVCCL